MLKMTLIRTGLSLIFLSFCTVISHAQAANLDLQSALELALENNYGIRVARSRSDIAGVNNTWGTAGRYPTIDFTASSNFNHDLKDQSTTNRFYAGLGIDWTLFNGFRVVFTKEKLELLEELSQGNLAVVVEGTITDVILSYYNMLLEAERLEVLKEVMELSEDRYEYERRRHQLGSTVTYNVLQAKNLFLADKANYLNQEVVVRNALRDLNFVLGEEVRTGWRLTDSFQADTTDYIMSDLVDKMLFNNQSLRNQYTNLLLAEKDIRLAKSAFYPSLSLSAGMDNAWSRSYIQNDELLDLNSHTPYGGLTLRYNIYQGGNRTSAVEIARIEEEINRTGIENMEHRLLNELYQRYDQYLVRQELLVISGENLEAAKLNLEISGEKFKSGAINSFNYRDIQLIYLDAALQRLQAVYNLIVSKTALTRITGGFLNYE